MRRAGCGHGGEKTASLGHALKVFCRTPGSAASGGWGSHFSHPPCAPVRPVTYRHSLWAGSPGLLLLLGLRSRVSLFSHPSVHPYSFPSDSLFPSLPNTIIYLLFQSRCLSFAYLSSNSTTHSFILLHYLDSNKITTDSQEETAYFDCWLVH